MALGIFWKPVQAEDTWKIPVATSQKAQNQLLLLPFWVSCYIQRTQIFIFLNYYYLFIYSDIGGELHEYLHLYRDKFFKPN